VAIPGAAAAAARAARRLLNGVHVSPQPRGVVGHIDLDVARIDLRPPLEGFLDLRLNALRAHRRRNFDVVQHAGHPADLADHPLNFAALVVVLDLTVQRDQAVFHPGAYLALGDLHIPLQDVRDRPGDVRVVPWRTSRLDFQVVGYGLDPIHPLRCPGSGQFLGEARNVAGQGHCSVHDGRTDGIGLDDLRVPAQLLDDVISDLSIGFHQLTFG
jgi:hypothetical protein